MNDHELDPSLNLPVGPVPEDDDLLDEELIDTLIQDGLFDDKPLPEEVELVDLEVYEDDPLDDEDDFENVVGDNYDDEDETDDEVDHFYGEDGKLVHDTFEDEIDDDDLL